MPVLFTNNASTTLAAGITNVATSITVATGQGALFPTITGSNFFYATLANTSNVLEIVKVTARSGDVMTVTRGQDGTTATAYSTGDKFELRPTAAALAWKVDQDFAGTLTGALTLSATTTINGTLTGTGVTARFSSPGAIGNTTASTGAFTTLTASTSVTAPNMVVNGATVPANGVYLPAANTLGFSSNSVSRGTVNSTGNWVINAPTSGVAFTVNGVSGTHSLQIEDSTGTTAFDAGYLGAPQNSQTANYTLALADRGKHISITTGGVNLPVSVFSPGDAVTIFNNSGSNQTVTANTGVTTRIAGTTTTGSGAAGNRTLANYGLCTVLCIVGGATPTFVVSGAGVT